VSLLQGVDCRRCNGDVALDGKKIWGDWTHYALFRITNGARRVILSRLTLEPAPDINRSKFIAALGSQSRHRHGVCRVVAQAHPRYKNSAHIVLDSTHLQALA